MSDVIRSYNSRVLIMSIVRPNYYPHSHPHTASLFPVVHLPKKRSSTTFLWIETGSEPEVEPVPVFCSAARRRLTARELASRAATVSSIEATPPFSLRERAQQRGRPFADRSMHAPVAGLLVPAALLTADYGDFRLITRPGSRGQAPDQSYLMCGMPTPPCRIL